MSFARKMRRKPVDAKAPENVEELFASALEGLVKVATSLRIPTVGGVSFTLAHKSSEAFAQVVAAGGTVTGPDWVLKVGVRPDHIAGVADDQLPALVCVGAECRMFGLPWVDSAPVNAQSGGVG